MQVFMKRNGTAWAVAAALMSLAIGAGSAQAYPLYDDVGSTNDCVSCHPDFQSVGSLHNQHLNVLNIALSPILAPQFTTRCNVCHTDGGGTTPVYTMGSNAVDFGNAGGGLGCAGCHGQDYGENATTAPYTGDPKASGWGLRRVHDNAGVTVCISCHGVGPAPLDETVKPPYYALQLSDARNPCDATQEDIGADVDTDGLDNDGNGQRDYPNDANCLLPTTTTTTTSTTTTTLPVACGPAPLGVCTAAEKAKLQINDKAAGKEKMKFQLTKLVPAVVPADFGNPVDSDTSYALCIYNAANALVATYEVARGSDTCSGAPCWEDFKTTGYQYADKDAQSADGISKMQLVGGDAGKGKVQMMGSNKASTLPTGFAAVLAGQTSATAQLISGDGNCFGMALPTVKKNDVEQFSAQAP